MGAPVGVRVAANRLGGLQPVKNRTARVPRFIPAVALILLALTLAVSLAAAVPRRSYYQLAVILNDSHAPDVDFTFWLDSPYPNNASYSDTMAATISITAVFGPELAFEQQAGGTYSNVTHNRIGDWSFYANTTETSQTTSPVFTTVDVTVTYTDNFDQNPRTIYRSLTFAVKYSPPAAPVMVRRYLSSLPPKLQIAVWEFERSHSDILAKWDGNVALLPQADLIAARFIRPRLRFHPN